MILHYVIQNQLTIKAVWCKNLEVTRPASMAWTSSSTASENTSISTVIACCRCCWHSWRSLAGDNDIMKKKWPKNVSFLHVSVQVALVWEVLLKAAENSSIYKIALYLIYVRPLKVLYTRTFDVSAA